jgi:hypothetical protein
MKYINCKSTLLVFLLLVLTGCAVVLTSTDYAQLHGPANPKQRILSAEQAIPQKLAGKISYTEDVKPILDSRCVACHACYDAPCQLKLSSFAGLDRGATKHVVYNAARLQAAEPTRLFIDATDTQGWRNKEFYPVLNERMDTKEAEAWWGIRH